MEEKEFSQTVGGVLQPTKIIIETRNFITQGRTYATDNLTILPINCSNIILGSTIAYHMALSAYDEIGRPNHRELRKNYLKKAKFKSEPAWKKEAKFVTIFKTNDSIIYKPYDNNISAGRWSNFIGMKDQNFEITETKSFEHIGNALRKAWSICIFS